MDFMLEKRKKSKKAKEKPPRTKIGLFDFLELIRINSVFRFVGESKFRLRSKCRFRWWCYKGLNLDGSLNLRVLTSNRKDKVEIVIE